MKVVMIGGGGASIVCANTLRIMGSKANIDMYTRRDRTGYTPCEQPFFLRKVMNHEDMFYAGNDWFVKKGIRLHLNTEVESIDKKNKTILANSKSVSYDILVINTGASPVAPDIQGLDGNHEYYLTSELSGIRKLEEIIAKSKKAAILGSGIIGVEMAETLIGLGYKEIYLIASSPHILSQFLDADMSKTIEPILTQHGIKLRLATTIERIESKNQSKIIKLQNGGILKVDFILIAKGVRPNVELAERSGLVIGEAGGIEVNSFLQTSDPNIYAIGDCMEGWNPIEGKKEITALATHANRTGRIAARNIHFGNRSPFYGSMGALGGEIFGSTICRVGYTETKALKMGEEVISITREGLLRRKMFGGEKLDIKLIVNKNKQTLIGAQLIGPREVNRIAERIVLMIGEQLPLSRISQYETIFSPPLSTAYDIVTMGIDIIIRKLIAENITLTS